MGRDGFRAPGPIEPGPARTALNAHDQGMEQSREPRPGDWWCNTCRGLVLVTEPRPVPLCRRCGAVPLVARRAPDGPSPAWESPAPTHCAGPAKHRFRPNRVKVGHRACQCRGRGGGHATWYCWECGDLQEAPACTSPRAERERMLRPGGLADDKRPPRPRP